MKPTPFSMTSLGCARNLVDSEKMIDTLQIGGFKLVPQGSGEAISIVNTCSFIQDAIDETEASINELIKKKNNAELDYAVVTGCYPSRYKKETLEEKFPEIDMWITTQEEGGIQEKLSELVFKKRYNPKLETSYIKLTPSHYAYIKISEGCDNWCSFCTIPKIRGTHKSKSIEDIIKEAKLQLSFGVKELILIAEDTTAWGEDIYGKPSLPLLLEELAKLPAKWIRPMYIFPSRVTDDLIRVIKKHDNITNYLDMPIQHASDDLLASMNRRHDKAFLKRIIQDMRVEIPQLSLRTTLIIGYPGETDAHIAELKSFLEDTSFEQLGVFAYSEERETRAARIKEKNDTRVIQQRMDDVMTHQFEIMKKLQAQQIGNSLDCIYEGEGLARSYREAPEVDSIIKVDASKELEKGTSVNVKITGVCHYDLCGELEIE